MHLREMKSEERSIVYKMEYREWSNGLNYCDFHKENIEEEKFGNRYVFLNNKQEIVSSLIIYNELNFEKHTTYKTFKIASVVTKVEHRNNGYATQMLIKVLEQLKRYNSNSIFFLHCDIEPVFYEKIGFRKLPNNLQTEHSLLMVNCNSIQLNELKVLPHYLFPSYYI